jgi:hypothetical protein
MKVVCLTLIVSFLSTSFAFAGNGEDMNRQRLLFCSQSLIEEQGTVVVVSGTVGVARNTGDCIKISR